MHVIGSMITRIGLKNVSPALLSTHNRSIMVDTVRQDYDSNYMWKGSLNF